MSATQTIPPPGIVVRGRSFLALTLAPEWPLRAWLAGLDAQRLRAASLFEGRPLVVNLAGAPGGPGAPESALEAALEALDALALRDLRVIGVDGVDADLLTGTRWGRLPTVLLGREGGQDLLRGAAAPAAADSNPSAVEAPSLPPSPSLLIDGPVRSGRSVVFEDGDVTVIGPVASGAEVIAGGSIHVYGALRGGAERATRRRRLGADLLPQARGRAGRGGGPLPHRGALGRGAARSGGADSKRGPAAAADAAGLMVGGVPPGGGEGVG